jgi:GNAT superfamily N-acetyltransferase
MESPSSRVRARAATSADFRVLVEFNLSMARESEGLELDRARLERGVEAALADPGRGFYLVAEFDGAPSGCLLVTAEWSDWRNGWAWWIQSVYVMPAARRHGVYSALHRRVLELARERGDVVALRLYVERNNLPAQATYRRLGMQESHYLMFEASEPPGR